MEWLMQCFSIARNVSCYSRPPALQLSFLLLIYSVIWQIKFYIFLFPFRWPEVTSIKSLFLECKFQEGLTRCFIPRCTYIQSAQQSAGHTVGAQRLSTIDQAPSQFPAPKDTCYSMRMTDILSRTVSFSFFFCGTRLSGPIQMLNVLGWHPLLSVATLSCKRQTKKFLHIFKCFLGGQFHPPVENR